MLKDKPMKKTTTPTRKKTVMEKYPTRQALVYSGAALLIFVTGLRTILQVAEEGFGFIEYMTLGALLLEFSMLLLYAWTIYEAGRETFRMTLREEEEAKKKAQALGGAAPSGTLEVTSKDIPEVAKQINRFSAQAEALLAELSKSVAANEKLNERLNELMDEHVQLKVRQEIQRLLSAGIGSE